MVGIPALWIPIVGPALFVLIALMLIHVLFGWHRDDTSAVPGEAEFLEKVRAFEQTAQHPRVASTAWTVAIGNRAVSTPRLTKSVNRVPAGSAAAVRAMSTSLMAVRRTRCYKRH